MLQSLSGQDILLSKTDSDDTEKALQSLQINFLSAEKNKLVKGDLRFVRHTTDFREFLLKLNNCSNQFILLCYIGPVE